MGGFLKGSAKVWFYAWDIPAVIALFAGHFQMFFVILGGRELRLAPCGSMAIIWKPARVRLRQPLGVGQKILSLERI